MSLYNKETKEKILELVGRTQGSNAIPGTTDGIGNKGYYHWLQRTFKNATIDALAMVLNDAVVKRFQAKWLQNHIMIPKEDENALLEIVSTLVEECKKREITIISGEISYHEFSRELEISISLGGDKYFSRKENKFEMGDYLIGIKSSGLHSNGFTKIREIFGDEFRKEFIEPTLIYSDALLETCKNFNIHGMTHVTGRAFLKLEDILGENDAVINFGNLKPPKIFYEIYEKGVSDLEMYKTFNCGIGFILGVSGKISYDVINEIIKTGFKADIIGEVVKGNGKIKINSMFSGKLINL